MAYSNQIPRATDQLNDSQLDLLNNFIAIQNLIGVNHIDFNLGVESGKHSEVTLPYKAAPTATGANEASLFANLSPYSSLIAGNNGSLFWKSQNNTGTIPLTAGYYIPPVAPVDPVQGWTILPSGFLVKFGLVPLVNGLNQLITYPVAAGTTPVFSIIPFMVLVTPFSLSASPRIVNVNASDTTTITVSVFNTAGAPAGSQLFYLAIGIGA